MGRAGRMLFLEKASSWQPYFLGSVHYNDLYPTHDKSEA